MKISCLIYKPLPPSSFICVLLSCCQCHFVYIPNSCVHIMIIFLLDTDPIISVTLRNVTLVFGKMMKQEETLCIDGSSKHSWLQQTCVSHRMSLYIYHLKFLKYSNTIVNFMLIRHFSLCQLGKFQLDFLLERDIVAMLLPRSPISLIGHIWFKLLALGQLV